LPLVADLLSVLNDGITRTSLRPSISFGNWPSFVNYLLSFIRIQKKYQLVEPDNVMPEILEYYDHQAHIDTQIKFGAANSEKRKMTSGSIYDDRRGGESRRHAET
jgi:hypothetical protein